MFGCLFKYDYYEARYRRETACETLYEAVRYKIELLNITETEHVRDINVHFVSYYYCLFAKNSLRKG